MHEKEAEKAIKMGASANSRPPYWQIFKQASPQLFNIFFVFFITLALFPAVQSGMEQHFLFDIFIFFFILIFHSFNAFYRH